LRERWFGASGRRVPELVAEGALDVSGALVLEDVADEARLREAFDAGTPVVVRASSPDFWRGQTFSGKSLEFERRSRGRSAPTRHRPAG